MTDPAELLHRLGVDPVGATFVEPAHNRFLTAGIWIVDHPTGRYVLKHLGSRSAGDTAFEAHWSAGDDDRRSWRFRTREVLAYRHAVTQAYAHAGIDGAPLVAADDETLLLGFVAGTPAGDWSIDRYAEFAHALGIAQATAPIPDHDWLTRGFLRDYATAKPVDWSLLDSDDAWAQPLIRANFPPGLRDAANAMHANSNRLFEIVESMPRVLGHLDCWTANLLSVDDRFVMLDWSFVGEAAPGEDIGNLVPDAAFDHFVPAAALPDLHHAVLTAHVAGLGEGGWAGTARDVELAMCASAVKYDWLTPLMLAHAAAPEQKAYGGAAIDADFKFAERGAALLHVARMAERALDLAR